MQPTPLAPELVTDFPAFNDLQRHLIEHREGRLELGRFESALDQLDAGLGALYANFHEELPFQVLDEELEPLAQEALAVFDVLQCDFELLKRAWMEGDSEALEVHEAAIRADLQRLFPCLERLRAGCAGSERFSDVPWLHELSRVALAARAGLLEPALLEKRLQQAEGMLQSLAVFEEHPGVSQALQLVQEALEQLYPALEDDWTGLEPACRLFREAGIELARLCLPAQPASIACARCGAAVSLREERCPACQAPVPRPLGEPAPAVVVSEQPGSAGGGELHELEALIQAARVDLAVVPELRTVLERFANRFRKGLSGLQAIPLPEAPAEELAVWRELSSDFAAHTENALAAAEQAQEALELGGNSAGCEHAEVFLGEARALSELLARLQRFLR